MSKKKSRNSLTYLIQHIRNENIRNSVTKKISPAHRQNLTDSKQSFKYLLV